MDIRKQQQGFTLVEVLVAIAVLTIGLLATAYMQAQSIEGNAQAIRTTKAATWAQDRIETLQALPYVLPNDHADLQDDSIVGVAAGVTGLNCTDTTAIPGMVIPPMPACLADGGPVTQVNKDGVYTVFWNVADNYPVFGSKTIRVLVRRSNSEPWRPPVTMDFIKIRPI